MGGNIGGGSSSSNNRHLNSENSFSESTRRNHKNADKAKYHYESSNNSRSIMASFQYQNGTVDAPISEKVDCVRTIIDPHSFSTPEKLILEPDIRVHPVVMSSWMEKFPQGARTVTVPRGDKGFGFIMVEKKVGLF